MNENNMPSLSDIAAVTNGNDMNGSSWVWFLLIVLVLGWGGAGMGGHGAPAGPQGVTESQMNNAISNQAIQTQLNQLGLSSANNNYETAGLINGLSNTMMQQNNTNTINAIQGFNNLSQQISNQTNVLQGQIQQLGFTMQQCCCDVKTQMLNDRLEDRNRQLLEAQNKVNLADQSQHLLANLGRFVAWEPSGSATTSSIAS